MEKEEEEEARLEKKEEEEEEVRRRGAIILDKEEFYRDAVWVSVRNLKPEHVGSSWLINPASLDRD